MIPHGQYSIRLTVNKDRSNEIMGESFDYDVIDTATAVKVCQPFQDILPHFAFIQREGKAAIEYSNKTSEGLFQDGQDQESYYKYKRDRDICLEETGEEIKRHFGGQTNEMKTARSDLMQEFFYTRSWTKIESLDLNTLKEGRERLWVKLNGVPYTLAPELAGPDKDDDDLKALELSGVPSTTLADGDIPTKAPETKITHKQSQGLYKLAREVYDDDVQFLRQVGVDKLTDADASLVPHIKQMIERKRAEKKVPA